MTAAGSPLTSVAKLCSDQLASSAYAPQELYALLGTNQFQESEDKSQGLMSKETKRVDSFSTIGKTESTNFDFEDLELTQLQLFKTLSRLDYLPSFP